MRWTQWVALGVILPVVPLLGTGGLYESYFKPLLGVYSHGDYYVEAELLYWTHSDCDYGYAVEIADILVTPPNDPPLIRYNSDRAKKEFVKPGYNPGIRLHIGFRSGGCFHQDLSYTWVEIRNRAVSKLDINSPFQPFEFSFLISNAFDGDPNKIAGEVFSRYQRITLELGSVFDLGEWGEFVAGGEYMWVGIAHHRNTTAFIPALGANASIPAMGQKLTFSGGGVGYFIGHDYKLGECGLRGIGKAALIGLMGRQRMTRSGIATLRDFTIDPPGVFAFNEEQTVPGRTCFIPAFEAMLGIGYIYEGRCFNARVNLSYEITNYVSALSYRIGGSGIAPPIPEEPLFGSIAYGGPTFSLEVSY